MPEDTIAFEYRLAGGSIHATLQEAGPLHALYEGKSHEWRQGAWSGRVADDRLAYLLGLIDVASATDVGPGALDDWDFCLSVDHGGLLQEYYCETSTAPTTLWAVATVASAIIDGAAQTPDVSSRRVRPGTNFTKQYLDFEGLTAVVLGYDTYVVVQSGTHGQLSGTVEEMASSCPEFSSLYHAGDVQMLDSGHFELLAHVITPNLTAARQLLGLEASGDRSSEEAAHPRQSVEQTQGRHDFPLVGTGKITDRKANIPPLRSRAQNAARHRHQVGLSGNDNTARERFLGAAHDFRRWSISSEAELVNSTTDRANDLDILKTYLRQASTTPLLTAEEEVDLAVRIEAGLHAEDKLLNSPPPSRLHYRELLWIQSDGRRAKQTLVQANLRLVISIARRYSGRGMAIMDLIQEGNVGLIRAVEKFDYQLGFKFSTYATWWIRQAITRGMADQSRTIRLPVHMVETILKISSSERALDLLLGRRPSPQEISNNLDISTGQVVEALRASGTEPISLEQSIDAYGTTVGEILCDLDSLSHEDIAFHRLLSKSLDRMLAELTSREAAVLKHRFGLDDGRVLTLEEIGVIYGVTRERIRQIEKLALGKLRELPAAAQLANW